MPRVAGYSPAEPTTRRARYIRHKQGRGIPRFAGHLARTNQPCTQVHGLFEKAPQSTRDAGMTQFAQGFAFDLAGALAGDTELAADFFEGA